MAALVSPANCFPAISDLYCWSAMAVSFGEKLANICISLSALAAYTTYFTNQAFPHAAGLGITVYLAVVSVFIKYLALSMFKTASLGSAFNSWLSISSSYLFNLAAE